MGTEKKSCYKCLAEVDAAGKTCPRCGAKLGARSESGIAAKPGAPLLKIFLVLISLAALGKLAVYSHTPKGAAAAPEATALNISTGVDNPRDGAILKIKEKGAQELVTVGIADIGYKDDTLCVYVNQKFTSLSVDQQAQLLSLMAGEWVKAIGKTSTAVKVLEYGTDKTLAELVV